MSSGNGVRPWVDNALRGLAGVVAIGAVGWCGWATTAIVARPTTEHVEKKIQNEAPYAQDRKLIMEVMQDTKAANGELRTAIENNTRAIVELRIALNRGPMP